MLYSPLRPGSNRKGRQGASFFYATDSLLLHTNLSVQPTVINHIRTLVMKIDDVWEMYRVPVTAYLCIAAGK